MRLNFEEILGSEARSLLEHRCQTIPRESIYAPNGNWVSEIIAQSDRPAPVLRSLQTLLHHGNLKGTGYTSIFPVDQGIEHSAAASFSKNPIYLKIKMQNSLCYMVVYQKINKNYFNDVFHIF